MISVIVPSRDPHPGRLGRAFAGLAAQTLPREEWEVLLVDNGSRPPIGPRLATLAGNLPIRLIVEPTAGLTPARLAGIRAARCEILVFVDDDNVLAPDFLASVMRRFAAMPALAAAGGAVHPEWEQPPPAWSVEFHGLLALRDFGRDVRIARGRADATWPPFAPVGAGLTIRSAAARAYAAAVANDARRRSLDRDGSNMASGGDNDIVFTALHSGGDVAYLPELTLTHLIPASRLEIPYLARLNRGVMRTWVRVLALHGQCPWPPIPAWSVGARVLRAWVHFRAWRGPAEWVRWSGARGQLEGQSDLNLLHIAAK